MTQRNKITAAIILVVVGTLIWFGLPKDPATTKTTSAETGQGTETPFTSSDPELAQLSLQRETDQTEIFRRAFWRNPGPEDKIRQAERREWSAASGVQRWDWFIAVDASESLTTYLLEQNPFQLNAISELQTFSEVPAWFPVTSAGFELHQSLNGEMTILFNPATWQLYATSKGHGFRPGAPEAEAPAATPQNQSPGRLPNQAPPMPEAR
jgi:hypothetical protein